LYPDASLGGIAMNSRRAHKNREKKAHIAAGFILRKIKLFFSVFSILAFNAARTSVLSPKVEALLQMQMKTSQ
jgi:hypothetical protein